MEYGTPINKISSPVGENDIGIFPKAIFFFKTFEAFLVKWLLSHIKPFLDPGQCGGLKRLSINLGLQPLNCG